MNGRVFRDCLCCAMVFATGYLWPLAQSVGQTRGESQMANEPLDTFVQKYLGPSSSAGNDAKRYVSAVVDLRDDGKNEVIVYITDREWCGTGGCTTLILEPQNSSYRIITRLTVIRLPIRVLESKSNGWHDLGVWVQGGGIQPGYEARLSFNGKTYPHNPSVLPAQPSKEKAPGKVVISEASLSGAGKSAALKFGRVRRSIRPDRA